MIEKDYVLSMIEKDYVLSMIEKDYVLSMIEKDYVLSKFKYQRRKPKNFLGFCEMVKLWSRRYSLKNHIFDIIANRGIH